MTENNLQTRIENLSKRSIAASKQAKIDAKNKKQYQWQDVQENAPEIAEFMIAVNKAFGKPKAVRVELNDGTVLLQHGEFDKRKC